MLGESLVFVGTYTETEGSQSEGIYAYRMDASSGRLTFDRVVKGVLNPSFLAIHPQRGGLSRMEHEVKVSMPVCLNFVSL